MPHERGGDKRRKPQSRVWGRHSPTSFLRGAKPQNCGFWHRGRNLLCNCRKLLLSGSSVHRANRAGLPARCVLSFSSVNMTPERGFAARWLRLFPFPLKIHFKGRQLPAGWGFSQIFFCLCNAENRILATGGAENFSFHSPHHRVLKFAKRNGQFPLCFLLRTKIQNAKRRGKKISLSLTTTIRTRQNGRKRSRATKKQ